MSTRRSFIATGAGILATPLINWRGHEALFAQQGHQPAQGGAAGQADRPGERLLGEKPGMIRIDSNENPNGPGKHVYDTIIGHLSSSNRYPVKIEDDLIAMIAKLHGVAPANVQLGCGSGELLRAA